MWYAGHPRRQQMDAERDRVATELYANTGGLLRRSRSAGHARKMTTAEVDDQPLYLTQRKSINLSKQIFSKYYRPKKFFKNSKIYLFSIL